MGLLQFGTSRAFGKGCGGGGAGGGEPNYGDEIKFTRNLSGDLLLNVARLLQAARNSR